MDEKIYLEGLLREKEEILHKINVIEEKCEGIDNLNNSNKIKSIQITKSELLAKKAALENQLCDIDLKVKEINELISNLSSKGTEKVLQAIEEQRWFFFKNKTKILFDKYTGYLWPNLNYFNYVKNKSEREMYNSKDDVIKIAKTMNIEGVDGWRLPLKNDIETLVEDKTFPFMRGSYHEIDGYNDCYVSDYHSIRLNGRFPQTDTYWGIFLPCNKSLIDADYKNHVSENNNIFSSKEKASKTLDFFLKYDLEPIFENEEISQLYKKIYIEKPKLLNKLNKIEEEIEVLQENVVLSSTFDYNAILINYNIDEIDSSIIKYYEGLQRWINELLEMLDYFEKEKGSIIEDFNLIGLKLSKKYDSNSYLTEEENEIFKNRKNFFKKHFQLSMNDIKNKLLNFKFQGEALEKTVEEANESMNSLHELAILEEEKRASFRFVAENTANIVRNGLIKIEYFEANKDFAKNIISIEEEWSKDYEVFANKIREDFKNKCEEESIEEETWEQWFSEWRKTRFIIEKSFLPLVELGLKEKLSLDTVQKLIGVLKKYKDKLDGFYIEDRKDVHQKFAFQVGGELQEKFEVESELYKVTSELQIEIQSIIFSIEKTEEKICILKWANNLIDIHIDEILDFVKDKNLSIISQAILSDFSKLKMKNYELYLGDIKAYNEERVRREKEYNSLIFKMRKDLMKQK